MDEIKEKKHVSFSKFSTWLKCPHKFYIDQVKGLKEFEDNINTCFGTGMHNTVQYYIKTLYTESLEKAESINLFQYFKESFDIELKEKKIQYTEQEYDDFIYDGKNILTEFSKTSNRIKHFPHDKYEFVGIEMEIEIPIKNNVDFLAYIDLVLRDKKNGNIRIIDFKTSTNGWNSYSKDDTTKTPQLPLYKAMYSKKYGVPLEKIEVEFFILKRKLYEGVNYPQERLQLFIPPNKTVHVVNVIKTFSEFVSSCFNTDGTYKEDSSNYPKNPGNGKKNCKFCPHKKIRCDQKQEME